MISNQDLAAQAEQILRTHVHSSGDPRPMLRALVLPAMAEYECWQVFRKRSRGSIGAHYTGVHGRWDAFGDARRLVDPVTGQATAENIVPSIEWSEFAIEFEVGERLLARLRALRFPPIAPCRYVAMDGIRYEIEMRDPEGSGGTSCFCWHTIAPDEWAPLLAIVDDLLMTLNLRHAFDAPSDERT